MEFSRFFIFAVLFGCVSIAQAEMPAWTNEDTEKHWAAIAEKSTRTSTSPRFGEADEESGEGVLEAFGTQYLPNAYAYYQEVRATAKEREQLFRENFPDGRSSDATGGALYGKVQRATAKAVSEMFRRHDELCHYLLLYRMGVVSDQELADLDSSRIAVVLPEEAEPPAVYKRDAPVLASAETDFATKYLPETRAAFQRLDNAFSEGVKAYDDWLKTALLVDATRSDTLFQPLRERLDDIHGQMDGIIRMVKEKKLLYAVGEASASALVDSDREMGLAIQQFEKGLLIGPIVMGHVRMVVKEPLLVIKGIITGMVQIPDRNIKMGKYEVTQAEWEAVMGENPARFKNPDNPVENVSWNDCQVFLKRLNALPAVKQSGLLFRLPTETEWEYACRAGATGTYCKLANGREITESTLGKVAWFPDNSDEKVHPVGQKEPNAFGLYDMFGNVAEWCQDEFGSKSRVKRGGCIVTPVRYYGASEQSWDKQSERSHLLGFRLCADVNGEVAAANEKPVVLKGEEASARTGSTPATAIQKKKTDGETSETTGETNPIDTLVKNMVPIPGRNYKMGKYEVTQAQWKAVMGGNPSTFQNPDNPVEQVSWDDCQEFLNKFNALPSVKEAGLTFRLPTEEEWEFACRAGATGDYCRLINGVEMTEESLGQVAWFGENSNQTSHPVGQKQPNAFGLYDMHGNVYEWTATAEDGNRVYRGGSWGLSCWECRSAWRDSLGPSTRLNFLGFRLCATSPEEKDVSKPPLNESTSKTSDHHKKAIEEYGDFADLFE